MKKSDVRTSGFQKFLGVWWPHLVAIFLFLGLAVFFFWPFINGSTSFIWDTREFGFFNLNQVTKSLAGGNFPLWNAYNFSGYPFAGDIESSMFYPVQWIFAVIFGAMKFSDLAWYFVFHFFLGGVFAYALCFKLTKNYFAAFVGAIVFTYSGYALGHISHLGQDTMYMWIPIVFLAYIKALEKRKGFYSLLAGLVFGMAILVGHSNTTVYLLLGLFILTIYSLAKNKKWISTGFSALLATIFALMIAAVLLMPVYELSTQSNRLNLTYEQQSQGSSLNPLNLIGMISPNHNHVLEANPIMTYDGSVDLTQGYFYIGIGSLILMALGLFSEKKYKWYFVIIGGVALMAAFGKYTYVNYILFNYFPGFNKARMAVQVMCLCFLAASCLSSMGMAKLMDVFEVKKNLKKFSAILGIVVSLVVVFDIFAVNFDKRFYSGKIPPNQVFDLADEQKLVSNLQGDGKDLFRISDEKNKLLQNKWEYYGVENVWGNGGIKIKKYNDLFERTDRTHWQIINDNLYDFLNVKYVFADRSLPSGHFQINKDGYYKNLKVLPRAYLVEKYVVEKDLEKQLAMIKDGKVNFAKEVLLSEDPGLKIGQPSAKNTVSWLMRTSSYLKLNVANSSNQILVLSEVDFAGWNLVVDGKDQKYLNANYVFRAVPLSAGNHVVEFIYRPTSVRIGAIISLFALGFFMIALARMIYLKRRND